VDTSASTGYECFDELIQQLRVEGHAEAADRLDSLLHHTAWTTGSELLGELGLAILAFKRQRPTTSAVLRQHLKACLRAVRRAWPGLKFR
jgi:hypothetical protein